MPGVRTGEINSEQICNNFSNSTLEQTAARNRAAVKLKIMMCLGDLAVRVASGWGRGRVAGALGVMHGMISAKRKSDASMTARLKCYVHRESGHRVRVEDTDEML